MPIRLFAKYATATMPGLGYSGRRACFGKKPDRHKKFNSMGLRLADYPHYRLTGSSEYRLRVGDYRVIYEFDATQNEIYVLAVGNRDKIYKRA